MLRSSLVVLLLAVAACAGCTEPEADGGPGLTTDADGQGPAGAAAALEPAGSPSASEEGPTANGDGGVPGVVGTGEANASSAPGPLPVWGSPDTADLFPGINDDKGCTTNFLFTSLDNRRIFLGSAAHCFVEESGNPTDDASSCDPTAVIPVGAPVRFRVPGQSSIDWTVEDQPVAYLDINGTLVYSSWQAMVDAGEDIEDPICWTNDFVLIEVPLEAQGRITPHFRGFGAPVGMAAPEDVAMGSDLVSYGNSQHWMGVEELHAKEGKVTQPPDPATRPYSFVAAFAPPGISGDSGSAALTADGKAAGVLVGYGWVHEGDAGTGEYAFLPALLAYLESHTGLAVKLAQP